MRMPPALFADVAVPSLANLHFSHNHRGRHLQIVASSYGALKMVSRAVERVFLSMHLVAATPPVV
jgi:hypothetical protein